MNETCTAIGRSGFVIRVLPYLFGQYRLQLIDTKLPNPDGPGQIVRELCTYHRERALEVIAALATAEDPEAVCEHFARPWNCEAPGGRIRLDNTPADRPECVA